jgi:Arc/MetJ-type ribon-helix-helix transcriptional regulator
MRRTTITLPDELANDVAREARRRHTSVSEVVRESLIATLREGRRDGSGRRIIPFSGIFESGDPAWAARVDEELAKTWADDIRRTLGGD